MQIMSFCTSLVKSKMKQGKKRGRISLKPTGMDRVIPQKRKVTSGLSVFLHTEYTNIKKCCQVLVRLSASYIRDTQISQSDARYPGDCGSPTYIIHKYLKVTLDSREIECLLHT